MSQYVTIHDLSSGNATYQTVATSGTSAQSTAVTARRISISVNTATFVVFGTNPTATTSGYLIPANTTQLFNFRSGDKVAGILATGTGQMTINVLDVSQ